MRIHVKQPICGVLIPQYTSIHPAAKNYEELIYSHELAKTFISELGEARRTPVCDSLLAYVKEMRFNFKSGDSIMELMESRLNKFVSSEIE